MITEKEYIQFVLNQQKMFTDDIKQAIKKQTELSIIAHKKQEIRDALLEKSNNLITIGFNKLKEKYPEIENKMSLKETKVDAFRWLADQFLNNTENYKYVSARMKEIPELLENQQLQDELGVANYEYINAVNELNKEIDEDRKRFFTKEYISKMDEYSDNGLLLYYLETPVVDLLDKNLTEDFLIDTYLFCDCYNLKILLDRYVSIPNPSTIMKRKGKDIVVTINLLNDGCYRSAARNIFALLESEHKRCADAFEGYFTKKKIYRKGHERARKIKELLDSISIEWEQHSWEKINNYYKNVFANNKIDGICYRNGIVHGDYSNDAIDTSEKEIVKLILMWLNLRVLADRLSILEDCYDNLLSYITGLAIEKENKA